MFFTILRITGAIVGGLIGLVILVLMGLSWISGTPSSETINKNALALAYLDKNMDEYGKCYRSVQYGGGMVSDVIIRSKRIGMTDEDITHLQQIGEDFKAQIRQRCDKVLADYKENYDTYTDTKQQIARDQQSLLDKMLGTYPEVDQEGIQYYKPENFRTTSGSPFSDYVFTKADVEQYFAEHQ